MQYVPTNDMGTAYEIVGYRLPLVLIHGGFVDQHQWQPQVAALG